MSESEAPQDCWICLCEVDDENTTLPCSHVACNACLVHQGNVRLKGDSNKYELFCVSTKTNNKKPCYKTIPWSTMLGALKKDDDRKSYEEKINFAYLKTQGLPRTCPKCKSLGLATKDVSRSRVTCRACEIIDKITVEFCVNCEKEWKNKDSQTNCGNNGCSDWVKGAMAALAHIPKKTIGEVQKVPGRVCPRPECCKKFGPTLMEHMQSCKHMTCKSCQKQFCYVCLEVKGSDGTWPCGSSSAKCDVAELQTYDKIFGRIRSLG